MDPPIPPYGSTLALFVYGTLMRGQANHRRFCAGATLIRPASVPGTLYHLPAGYPAMSIDFRSVIARGSDDLARDLAVTVSAEEGGEGSSILSSEHDRVHGEVIWFRDGVTRLEAIDRLEGFRPGGGLYDRVLIRATVDGAGLPVWTYIQHRPRGTRIPGGRWQGNG